MWLGLRDLLLIVPSLGTHRRVCETTLYNPWARSVFICPIKRSNYRVLWRSCRAHLQNRLRSLLFPSSPILKTSWRRSFPFERVGPPPRDSHLEFGREAPLRADRGSFGTRLAGYLIGWAYWAVSGRGVSPGEGRTQPLIFPGFRECSATLFCER